MLNLKRKQKYVEEEEWATPQSPLHSIGGSSAPARAPSWAANNDSVLSPAPRFLVGLPIGSPLEKGDIQIGEQKRPEVVDRPLAPPLASQRPPIKKHLTKKHTVSNRLHRYWIYEEISFSMNKISLFGLVFGLMVLGALFFTMGFLVAVATLNERSSQQAQQQTTWSSANSAPQQQGIPPQQQTAPQPATAAAKPNQPPSAGGKILGGVVGSMLRHEGIKLESKLGGGAVQGALSHVPAPLQPFAMHAQNRATARAQGSISGATGAISHGQYPGSGAPAQPQGQQPYPPQQQQYPQPGDQQQLAPYAGQPSYAQPPTAAAAQPLYPPPPVYGPPPGY